MDQTKENREHISKMIAEAFELVRLTYEYHNAANHSATPINVASTGSRLVFPKNRNGKVRISEQELRFAFVEVFNRYVSLNGLNWFYSIEMPTRKKYSFSGNGMRNALFDLSVLDAEFNRIALIEFKAKNPKRECYEKDMAKLSNPAEDDANTLKYFLQILENHDNGTITSIEEKTRISGVNLSNEGNPIYIRVYSLSKGEDIINKTTI